MSRICTVCARGGSKGVKNKNIRDLMGKPLIAHSIHQAKSTNLFEAVIVSSDSEDILNIAKDCGADFVVNRPKELATDHAAKIPVIQHCVQQFERHTNKIYSIIVDLDATSPLRNIVDIHEAVSLLEEKQVNNVISGSMAKKSPYFNIVERDSNGNVKLSKTLSIPIVRRQDSPKCFDLNGSIYVWNRDGLFKQDTLFHQDTLLYEMPEERSIDIDSELDFEFIEFLLKKEHKGV